MRPHRRAHHLGRGASDRVERAREVRVDDALPLVVRHAGDESVLRGAGVVHEQLDGPECVFDLAERAVDRGRVANVGSHRERVGARLLDRGARGLGAVVVARVAERDTVAGFGERDRAGAADPARPSGDERGPSVGHGFPHRRSALAQVIPAPNPDMSTRSPSCSRPSSAASASASGIDAADVLP